MIFGKKPVEVLGRRGFVAAYSTHPFVEANDNADYPDYSFYRIGKMHWCVRIGQMKLNWGFGLVHCVPFAANGEITLSRKNVSGESFDGRGFRYTKLGEVFYLDEDVFLSSIKVELLEIMKSFARGSSSESFARNVNMIDEYPPMKAFLEKNRLALDSVLVKNIE